MRAPIRPFDANEAATLHAHRAGCLSRLKRWADAEEEASRALELRPDVPTAYGRLATALDGQGRHAEAFFALNEATNVAPRNAGCVKARSAAEARCQVFERRGMKRADAEARQHAKDLKSARWNGLFAPDEPPPDIRQVRGPGRYRPNCLQDAFAVRVVEFLSAY